MHPLRIQGRVEVGDGMARNLGCPTANIAPEQGLVIPGAGVYLALTSFDSGTYNSLVCVGGGQHNNFKLEVHLLDENIDLGGKSLEVILIKKQRPLIPWPGPEKMREIIQDDIVKARAWFNEFCDQCQYGRECL